MKNSMRNFGNICAAVCFGIIVFFGLFHITEAPPFTPDEGWAVQMASNIGHFGIDGTQFAPGIFEHVSTVAVSYPLLYTLGLWLKIFGTGVFQARLMMVLYMLACAAVVYLFSKQAFGQKYALASLAILATFPPFYAIGKSVYGETSVMFFLIASMLCLSYAFKAGAPNGGPHRRLWFILAGVSAGVCMAAKPMALVLGPVLIVGAIIAFRRKLATWRDIGIVAFSALVPLIAWAIVTFHYPGTLAHIGEYYANPGAVTDHWTTFMHALKFLLTTSSARYCLVLVAVWIVGMIVRRVQRASISPSEWMGFLFAATTLVSFFFHYADARYLFPIQMLAIMCMPYGLMCILEVVLKRHQDGAPENFAGRNTPHKAFVVIVVFLAALGLYQLTRSSYVAQSYSNTTTHDMQAYFGAVPPTTTILFYNAMNAVPLFHGTNYYQRIVMFEKWQSGVKFAPLVKARVPDLIVITNLSAADKQVPLTGYEQVAQFGEMSVFAKKGI